MHYKSGRSGVIMKLATTMRLMTLSVIGYSHHDHWLGQYWCCLAKTGLYGVGMEITFYSPVD